MAEAPEPVRIDKWLWAARLAKTRPVAAELVKGGHVELNGRRVAPGKKVAVGDRVEVVVGELRRTVLVRGLAERRGPASVAVTLYEETLESVEQRERLAAERRAAGEREAARSGPRPTKRDRRRLDATSARRGRGS
jgi:ribosome-associated heat shock protein Hsp15